MFLFKKEVDKSLLHAGLSIPIKYQYLLMKEIGIELNRGQTANIQIEIDGEFYSAIISKYKTENDMVQIHYGGSSAMAQKLRSEFSYSNKMISYQSVDNEKEQPLEQVSSYAEFVAIYSTNMRGVLSFDCINHKNIIDETNALLPLGEIEAERIFNATDAEAGIKLKIQSCKIRKMNRSIGNDLKELYGYHCQICGQYIGEQYGSNLIHTHHIQYFTESLNNDASNILIVCPNHHGIIHDVHPIFDFDKKVYHYPNGYTEGLKLNKHI